MAKKSEWFTDSRKRISESEKRNPLNPGLYGGNDCLRVYLSLLKRGRRGLHCQLGLHYLQAMQGLNCRQPRLQCWLESSSMVRRTRLSVTLLYTASGKIQEAAVSRRSQPLSWCTHGGRMNGSSSNLLARPWTISAVPPNVCWVWRF